MSLRQKLLLLFSLTVAAAVAVVSWTVLIRIRHVFELRDQEETALFVSQFQREFQHESADVVAAIDHLASGERVRAMSNDLAQTNDTGAYLNEAANLAQDVRLDFLEIVAPDLSIVSSAQWPARFGYPEPAVIQATSGTFLKREELPDGTVALGIFAVRALRGSEAPVRLIGGKRLDQAFLADLPVAPGMSVALYTDPVASTVGSPFDPKRLVGPAGELPAAANYKALVNTVRASGNQRSAILYLGRRREDSVNVTAIPLKDATGGVLGVLLVSVSRSGLVAAQKHIRAIAYAVAGAAILLTIGLSLWIAARVSRPVEELARAAEAVAAGDWNVHVPERGRDEVTVLARSFNHMTAELASQRERLVQSERVAAWRELARRLAHELKNPLFPLQITIENLVRARQLAPAEFDEVFDESTRTLQMEIANLKTIIGRFSDFSKMPKPELEAIDARTLVDRVRILYSTSKDGMHFEAQVAAEPMPLMVDPELMHRALSNLVLNAMDAIEDSGVVTLGARPVDNHIELRVSDTGQGLTSEECERLFTPYYTTKQHGTGLGLAIVQSVVADHHGTISVESNAGRGATFILRLPRAIA